MRIAYLYERPTKEAKYWRADKVFVDYASTRRAERGDLVDGGGLREGDTLVIHARSQLGHGMEAKRIIDKIEAMGVTVEVTPLPEQKAHKKGRVKVTEQQKVLICGLWYSTEPADYVMGRASDILGFTVNRNQMNRLCGPRGGGDD